jgi:hypothetical protein
MIEKLIILAVIGKKKIEAAALNLDQLRECGVPPLA